MSVWVIMGHDDTPGKTKEANDIMGHKIHLHDTGTVKTRVSGQYKVIMHHITQSRNKESDVTSRSLQVIIVSQVRIQVKCHIQ